MKSGRAPRPIRLSAGIVAWRASDIDALAASFIPATEPVKTRTEADLDIAGALRRAALSGADR